MSKIDAKSLFTKTVFDIDGKKVDDVQQVFANDNTGDATWVTVVTKGARNREVFIPLDDVRVEGESIHAPYSTDSITNSPTMTNDKSLTAEEEEKLRSYYAGVRGKKGSEAGKSGRANGVGEARDGQDAARTADHPHDAAGLSATSDGGSSLGKGAALGTGAAAGAGGAKGASEGTPSVGGQGRRPGADDTLAGREAAGAAPMQARDADLTPDEVGHRAPSSGDSHVTGAPATNKAEARPTTESGFLADQDRQSGLGSGERQSGASGAAAGAGVAGAGAAGAGIAAAGRHEGTGQSAAGRTAGAEAGGPLVADHNAEQKADHSPSAAGVQPAPTAGQRANEKAQDAKVTAQHKAEQTKAAAQEKAEQAKAVAQDKTEQAKATAQAKVAEAKERLAPVAEDYKNYATGFWGRLKSFARQEVQNFKEKR
ncbi:PRC-barrel domain-containing protein [Arthrobacter sp. UM1]|uniref:PRC-barrel domain-containing protein n=1 Tax=Arthrobacter sp. UM1 TaxID=2766776 RepID=UPI001CF64A92|nr:PRC-barrel domain-containing protein [Arthrobacter sp. UM1]MCB4208073.1 PRC-barrel domain-containing protein [Arthrobacter sp. UM1]